MLHKPYSAYILSFPTVSMHRCRNHALEDARQALINASVTLHAVMMNRDRTTRRCPESVLGLQHVIEAALSNLRDASLVLGHAPDAAWLVAFQIELR